MSIFNKRNALVGFLTLKAIERRRQRKRHPWKLAALVVLGIVSAGILAAVAAAIVHRQKEAQEPDEAHRLEGYAVADEPESQGSAELDAVMPKPGFAA
jgi:hypothetical protein